MKIIRENITTRFRNVDKKKKDCHENPDYGIDLRKK